MLRPRARSLLLAAGATALASTTGYAGGTRAAPPASAPAAALTVLAASSLTDVLPKVAAAWQAEGNGAVTVSFDASSRLAKQVEAGAAADLFFSADSDWMDTLEAAGHLAPGTRVDLLGNTLVVVVGANAAGARIPADAAALATPAITHLALAGENVPAGKYGRTALRSLGVWNAVQARVVSGDNVRTALGWVATGEADAAIVYGTDAKAEPRVKVAFTLPAGTHPAIDYPAAVLANAAHPADAARFLTFCRSPEAGALFAAAGFLPPPP
jgi:molybdate transport system substrate-binding protein